MCTNYRAPHEDYELRELKIQPFSDLYRRFPWKPEISPDYLAPIVRAAGNVPRSRAHQPASRSRLRVKSRCYQIATAPVAIGAKPLSSL